MALSVQLIPNRSPFVAVSGVIHLPVAVYGLHQAPELSMADVEITMALAEARLLVGEPALLSEWQGPAGPWEASAADEGEVSACRAIGPSPVRAYL